MSIIVYKRSQDKTGPKGCFGKDGRVERFDIDPGYETPGYQSGAANPGLTAPGSVKRTALKAGKGKDLRTKLFG
ncbi:MAG: hypothetical protein ABI675_27805 [Chitinophagaceae bacterium]